MSLPHNNEDTLKTKNKFKCAMQSTFPLPRPIDISNNPNLKDLCLKLPNMYAIMDFLQNFKTNNHLFSMDAWQNVNKQNFFLLFVAYVDAD